MIVRPLFKWAGGKRKMLKHILPLLPKKIDGYCEPFFGGGALFAHIITHHRPKRVIINDINPGLMSIYQQVRDNHLELLGWATEMEKEFLAVELQDRKEWYYQLRHRHAYHFSEMSKAQEAATLFFLMRTSFNGLYLTRKCTNDRFGTPSGTMSINKVIYPEVLQWWHRSLQDVEILSGDWKEAIKGVDDNYFTFLDPPYRGCSVSYGQQFGDAQQLKLLQWARGQRNVMLCNSQLDDGFWDSWAGGVKEVGITYTAGRRKSEDDGTFSAKKAKEVLLYNIGVLNGRDE